MKEETRTNQTSCLATGLATILAIIFVLMLPFALLLFNFERVFFDSPTVTRVLTDELLHSDLAPVVLEWFSNRRAQERVETGEVETWVEEPDIVELISFLDREDWRQIRAEALTDEMVGAWVPQLVNGFYGWIDSDDPYPQVTLDLQVFKLRLDSEHGRNTIVIAYAKLPVCTEEQIRDFESRLDAAPAGAEVLYNLCKFPDPWHSDQFDDYMESLANLLDNVPDSFVLADALGENPEGPSLDGFAQWLGVIKWQLRLLRSLSRWLWIVPVASLLLILALIVRSMKSLANWWGIPLLVGGLLGLPLAVTYQGLIARLFSAAPDLIRPEAVRATARLATEAFRPLLIQASVIAVVGLILVVVGAFVRTTQVGAAPGEG